MRRGLYVLLGLVSSVSVQAMQECESFKLSVLSASYVHVADRDFKTFFSEKFSKLNGIINLDSGKSLSVSDQSEALCRGWDYAVAKLEDLGPQKYTAATLLESSLALGAACFAFDRSQLVISLPWMGTLCKTIKWSALGGSCLIWYFAPTINRLSATEKDIERANFLRAARLIKFFAEEYKVKLKP